ncbi:MAG: Rap1a/Tai family immunity protein [Chromatiales bacterium]
MALSIAHPAAWATTPEELLISNAQDLSAVCSTQSSDPLYTAGINFCEGFIEGAYHYYSSLLGPGIEPFVCLPKPEPTRDEVTRRFVAWSKWTTAHLRRYATTSTRSSSRSSAHTASMFGRIRS